MLLAGLAIVSAPVLYTGQCTDLDELLALIGTSRCKTPAWRDGLARAATAAPHVDIERTIRATDPDDRMEGLYVKVEEEDVVVNRCKWVRALFHQVVKDADSHWFGRPIVANRLRPGTELFASGSPP